MINKEYCIFFLGRARMLVMESADFYRWKEWEVNMIRELERGFGPASRFWDTCSTDGHIEKKRTRAKSRQDMKDICPDQQKSQTLRDAWNVHELWDMCAARSSCDANVGLGDSRLRIQGGQKIWWEYWSDSQDENMTREFSSYKNSKTDVIYDDVWFEGALTGTIWPKSQTRFSKKCDIPEVLSRDVNVVISTSSDVSSEKCGSNLKYEQQIVIEMFKANRRTWTLAKENWWKKWEEAEGQLSAGSQCWSHFQGARDEFHRSVAIQGSVPVLFRDSFLQLEKTVEQKKQTLVNYCLKCKSHVDCRRVAYLILVFHCVAILLT